MSLDYACLRASDYASVLKIGILSRIPRREETQRGSTWRADVEDTVETFCFRVRCAMQSVAMCISGLSSVSQVEAQVYMARD